MSVTALPRSPGLKGAASLRKGGEGREGLGGGREEGKGGERGMHASE